MARHALFVLVASAFCVEPLAAFRRLHRTSRLASRSVQPSERSPLQAVFAGEDARVGADSAGLFILSPEPCSKQKVDLGQHQAFLATSATGVKSAEREAKVAQVAAVLPWWKNVSSVAVSMSSTRALEPISCGQNMVVTSASDKDAKCPEGCPLMVQNTRTDDHCDFQCVSASVYACKAEDPNSTVPDIESGQCRSCMIPGCRDCKTDGTDACATCSKGYYLSSDGTCKSHVSKVLYVTFAVLGILVACVLAWILDLNCREVTNQRGLERGLHERSRAKLHMPPDSDNPDAPRDVWPLWTNLCRTSVAGHGILLSFNFQAMMILWAIVLAVVWACFIIFIDEDLGILGTRRASTAWANCWVVQWGFETQHRLMWAKIAFLVFCYIFSVVGALLYSIRQLRMAQLMDEDMTTHMDFAACITGLPETPGTEPVERQLKELVDLATGQTSVAVSVCWDMKEKEDLFHTILTNELDERDDDGIASQEASMDGHDEAYDSRVGTQSAVHCETTTPRYHPKKGIRWLFTRIESVFLSSTAQWIITKGRRKDFKRRQEEVDNADGSETFFKEVDTLGELKALYTCDQAYVVFFSEQARDDAVKAAAQSDVRDKLEYRGNKLKLVTVHYEPESVVWVNHKNYHGNEEIVKRAKCAGMVAGALAAWTVFFYMPYLYFAMSFNYAHGQEPDGLETTTFGMMVVLGNALMYFICSAVADRMRFNIAGDREVCYFLLYTFACVFNVVLDLYIAYRVAYHQMVGVGMRTYYGTPLEDVSTFPERFETYAMQRELGTTLMEYAFPSTFLIPFLLEPIITIYIPYRLMVCFVRTHPELTDLDCESYLESIPMDLSRYADIWLNVMLASLILYFPGGFNLKMFLGLALSHVWIYMFDHYRVLRSIPSCNFSKPSVDWWAQWMCSIPCGAMLSCLIFKHHTERIYSDSAGKRMHESAEHGESRWGVFVICSAAFLGHVILHTLVLLYVVPLFGKRSKQATSVSYEECSSRIACSWFTSNPINCLRTQYFYSDEEAGADYCIAGKEHLIRLSPKYGVYWNDSRRSKVDFTISQKPRSSRSMSLSAPAESA